MAIIVPIEMPDCCSECPFETEYEAIYVDVHEGTFKYIARCEFQPEEVEDGYKDMNWLAKNRFPWCPLKPAKEDLDDRHSMIELPRNHLLFGYANKGENL